MANSYLTDLLDQPRALQATLDSLVAAAPLDKYRFSLDTGKYRRIILTGMGSSYHGLYPLQLRLFQLPIGVIRLETAELLHYASDLIDPENLIVAVSQSGWSAEIVQLMRLTERRVDLIGVTNTTGSDLAVNAGQAILTRAGDEATVSCKTYISGLAALVWLGDQLLGEQGQFASLKSLPGKITDYWSDWQALVNVLCRRLEGVKNLYLLGRGSSLAAALSGALIIKEASRFSAEGMNCAAFRHGPLELVSGSTLALVYLGDGNPREMNIRLAKDIIKAGGQVEQVGTGEGLPPYGLPDCPAAGLPLLEIMAAQLVSLALAELHGHQAGTFQHASKITTVE